MMSPDTLIPHSRPTLTSIDREAVAAVLNSGMIARGSRVAQFEGAVAEYLGRLGAVALGSGSAAIFVALKAMGVGPGDEVILPTYLCRTVLTGVEATGATGVLCDISQYWTVCRTTIERCLSNRSRAVIVPHIGGLTAEAEPVLSLGLPVIEDIAQCFGGIVDGRRAGTLGECAVCSFQAIKCLATGEGGMIVADDAFLLRRARELSCLAPMSDLQAALGLSQMSQLDWFLQRRQEIARQYFEALTRIPVTLIPEKLRKGSMFFRFPVQTMLEYETAKAMFEERGIAIRRLIDSLLHRERGQSGAEFPNAERRFADTISLPIYPSLSADDSAHVAVVAADIFANAFAPA